MKNNRDFEFEGRKYSVVDSNNFNWKYQAMVKTERGWERIRHYANTIVDVKIAVKENDCKRSYSDPLCF